MIGAVDTNEDLLLHFKNFITVLIPLQGWISVKSVSGVGGGSDGICIVQE